MIKKLSERILTIGFCFCALACSSDKLQLPSIDAQKLREFDTLNDSTFLGKVVDIDVYEEHFFLLDRSATRVYELDKDQNLLKTHLTKGDGPEEVGDLLTITIDDGKIFLFDQKAAAFKSFLLSGQFESNLKTPSVFTSEFAVNSDYFFYGSYREADPMTRIDLGGNESFGFGKKRKWPNKRFYAQRHIAVTSDEKLISVLAYDIPIVELYTFDGKLLTSLDLSSLDLFEFTHEKYEKDILPRRNTSLVFIKDICLLDGRLYLLVSSFSSELKNSYNRLIECEVSSNKITPIRIINLSNDAYYLAFSIYNEGRNFIGFDIASNSIEIFEIDKNTL